VGATAQQGFVKPRLHMHKPLLFTLLFLLASAAALRAQACNFDNLMREGKAFLDKKKPEYRRALYKFNAARTCDPNQSAVVDKEVDRLFGMIEGERDKVVVALAETERARLRADAALLLAETEKKKAIAAKEIAEAAEQKATAVLDKIYFYKGRFGMAYDKGSRKYGFIDKNLGTKIGFKYGEALPFERTGFAKVKKENGYFFIDTLGNEYPLATELNQLSSKITALDLRGKELTEIPDTVLKSFQLKVLLLSENQLQALPPHIGELKSLQSLDLSDNKLKALPAEIGDLKCLQSLDIQRNQVQILPAQIGKLKNLQWLDLSWNKLDSLPAQIGELYSLQWLDLSINKLQTLPPQIGDLKNLQSLDLSQNKFQTLPSQIGELKSLQSLDLMGNELPTLPAQIGKLKSLQSLSLSGNDFQTLPAHIGELKNLQSLDLVGNDLQTLPAQIGELKNLQSLDLSGNDLQTLPAQIGELKNLQSLELSVNKLRTLPAQIGELKSLRSLIIYINHLQTLPTQIGGLKNLQSFDLRVNQLEALPTQIGELKNLQSLELTGNQLQTLPVQIGELKNLQSLDLISNQLQSLPLEAFGKLSNLKKIVLADEQGSNPIPEPTVFALRSAMPWCEIVFNPKALFEENEAARKESEADVIQGESRLKNNPTDTLFQKELANTYNSLDWYQLLTGQFAKAEASINRGFELDSTNLYLPINRAAALLFQGKTEAAKQEYEKWKDLPFGEMNWPFYRDAFLAGLEELEKAGIIPEARRADVEAVRQLLGEKK
jgi:Leucine-rich repeat (LRR) protein